MRAGAVWHGIGMETAANATRPTTSAGLPDEMRLGPARLVVTDLERAIAWYERVIGLATIERTEGEAALGTPDGTAVLELEANPGARRPGRHAGLYHVALLFPSREELARAAVRIAATATMIEGASDHGTHEAIYLPDPDGNGLELAADRPANVWPNLADIEEIRPRPLDVQSLLASVDGEELRERAADDVRVGHLHLHVGDIERAHAFYVEAVGFDPVTRIPVAEFVSAGGYHHHLAFNTWKGEGIKAAPHDTIGLRYWTMLLPTTRDIEELQARVRSAGFHPQRSGDGTLVLRDPWDIELRVRPGA